MKIETLQHVSKGRRRTTVLLRALACCAFLCTSCAMEEELADSVMGGSTTMKINVDAHAGDDGEETVRTVRILTVDARDREVVANQLFQGPGASGEYTVKAFTGKNNFYVICNETPGMTRQLESVRQADDIEACL